MRIIFLGTNGWYTDEKGNTACILIDAKDHYVIFDAGNGFYKLNHYITENKPVSLFISHFHLDHVSGLHTLGKFSFPKGIDIFVGQGRKNDFETLVNPPYTVGFEKKPENIHQQNMEIRLHELSEGEHELPFPLSVIELFHGYKNHGFRITLENKIIAYSGDCGITEASKKLAENADVLIHECSYKDSVDRDTWGHTSPTQAATLARQAHVKQLLLTHFDPIHYPTREDRITAQEKAKRIFPQTTAAKDDLEVRI